MTKTEQIQKIANETQKLEQLRKEVEQAESNADFAEKRNLHRTDGSDRQDRLNEQISQNTSDKLNEASAAYNRQEKLVKELVAKL